jgi:hypothetical protein
MPSFHCFYFPILYSVAFPILPMLTIIFGLFFSTFSYVLLPFFISTFFILCSSLVNLRPLYSILAMDETQRGSKPMGEATIRRYSTFKKPKPDRLVCRKSLKSAKGESWAALWVGRVGTGCQTPKQLATIEIT